VLYAQVLLIASLEISLLSFSFNREPAASSSRRRVASSRQNQLNFQQLEQRHLLAAIVVNNATDIVSPTADTSSIAALIGNDGGDGISLREAITASNNTVGADTISFDGSVFTGNANSLIRLTQGELFITEEVSIDASMATDVVITGDANGDDITVPGTFVTDVDASFTGFGTNDINLLGDNSRVIRFSDSNAYEGTLTLSDLTITGGNGSQGRGGGIIATGGSLTLTNSHVRGNSTTTLGTSSGQGGGILGRRIRLINSVVSENRTFGDRAHGGGILVSGPGEITLHGSTVSGNSTYGGSASGGGIFSSRANLTLIDSTITNNSTSGFRSLGGGIRFAGPDDTTLTSLNSTISGNQTQFRGGGIATSIGTIRLVNSTLAGNTVVSGSGGGVDALASEVFIANSTISGNSASSSGGVSVQDSLAAQIVSSTIYDNSGGGVSSNLSLEILNSIVAGNVKNGVPADLDAPFGVDLPLTIEHSLIGDTTGSGITATTGNRNILNQPALLGPLADNGGPTLTHALLAGSPAIDAGSDTFAVDADGVTLTTDQRGSGFDRILNGRIDIGAVESDFDTAPIAPYVVSATVDEGGILARPDLWNNLTVVFDSNVSVDADDLSLVNDSLGGTAVDLTGVGFTYDASTNTATWDFNTLDPLEPAFYSYQLDSSSITYEGLALDGNVDGTAGDDFVSQHYVAIPGDANLDGVVDILNDAFALVGNLGSTTELAWSDGNFNGDEAIDVLGDAFVLVGDLNRDVRPPLSSLAFAASAIVSTVPSLLQNNSDVGDRDDSGTAGNPVAQKTASPELLLAGDHELRDDVFGSDF
jgi:hypothetical protein